MKPGQWLSLPFEIQLFNSSTNAVPPAGCLARSSVILAGNRGIRLRLLHDG